MCHPLSYALQAADPYDFAEPVDVVKQLDKAFWEGLNAAKWTERRDALQRLRGITASPRLATGDFGDLMRELKKICIKDSNVVCVSETVACIGASVTCPMKLHAQGNLCWLVTQHADHEFLEAGT